jgi:hypothetical protein
MEIFMSETKVRYPKKDGAAKATEMVSRLKKKEPSDRLVKIISEYGTPATEKNKNEDGQAAKQVET